MDYTKPLYHDIDSRIQKLINTAPSDCLLSHIAQQAAAVIPCYHAATKTEIGTTANFASTVSQNPNNTVPPLPTFVNLLARRSSARTGTLLASLVLLDRLRQRLSQFARGMPCTCQRIFLATLIVTTKLLHDTSPKNKHWVKYAVYFTHPEINLMESQLLALLDYRLTISETDLYYSFLTYDNMLNFQLHQQYHYLRQLTIPKSASCRSNSTLLQGDHQRFINDSDLNCQNCMSITNLQSYQHRQQDQNHYYQPLSESHYRNFQRQHIYEELQSHQNNNSVTKTVSSSASNHYQHGYGSSHSIMGNRQNNYINDINNDAINNFNNGNGSRQFSYCYITTSTSSSSLSSSLSSNSTIDESIFTPTTSITAPTVATTNSIRNADPTKALSRKYKNMESTTYKNNRNLIDKNKSSSTYRQHVNTVPVNNNASSNYNNATYNHFPLHSTITVDNLTAAAVGPDQGHPMLKSTSLMWFDTVLGHQPKLFAKSTSQYNSTIYR
ncbi:hypothetical protein BDF20DRAFT_625927 [Mycotypha africana]|uniref:uncharacterized protein n=1 Tax=Mycotypha africana TaxID=64632 RepID=UPI002301394F|nr:uncharacterized protein BDF20DRAFT_625927 [Mycotypha africana]KAI8975714.1 hypothetical protein BDF20DRAFT_625927 [Mycotypha africana]